MKKPMQISLKAGERIYINGAVIRVDRKVSLELLNDVAFLLEAHVLQVDETTTPLRQLYFILQTMLMDPLNAEATRALYREAHASTMESFANEAVRDQPGFGRGAGRCRPRFRRDAHDPQSFRCRGGDPGGAGKAVLARRLNTNGAQR